MHGDGSPDQMNMLLFKLGQYKHNQGNEELVDMSCLTAGGGKKVAGDGQAEVSPAAN